MVKREQPSSPVSSEHGSPPSSSHSLDIEPTKKRSQRQTTFPSKKAKTSPTKSPKSKPDGVITNEIKAAMADAAFDMAYKQLPFDQYAAEVSCIISRQPLFELIFSLVSPPGDSRTNSSRIEPISEQSL